MAQPLKQGENLKKQVLIVALMLCQAEYPAWALRCGPGLVDIGDYSIQVLRKCGDPVERNHRVEYRLVLLRSFGLDIEQVVPMEVEEWTYNFGPTRFMERLRFENGRLVESRPLGYGF